MTNSCATCVANETTCRDWRRARVEWLSETIRKRLPKDLQEKPWERVTVCADCYHGNDWSEPREVEEPEIPRHIRRHQDAEAREDAEERHVLEAHRGEK